MNIPPKAKVILYCSRITRHKARICMLLIKACRDLKLKDIPNLHVIIVGNGSQLKDIKNMAASIHSSCKEEFIHFTGEQQNVKDYYALADYVVGTGRVALEAMACERPVISCGNLGYFGEVNSNNFQQAWECYFGDHAAKKASSQAIIYRDLRNLHQSSIGVQTGRELRKLVLEHFDSKKIYYRLLNYMKAQFNHLNSSRPSINGSAAVLKYKTLTMIKMVLDRGALDSLLGE